MRKAGAFLYAFLPYLIVSSIITISQEFTSCLGMLLCTFTGNRTADMLYNLLLDTDFNMILMLVYTMISILLFGFWYYCCCNGDLQLKPAVKFHPLCLAGILLLIPGAQLVTDLIINMISFVMPQWLQAYEELLESSGGDSMTLLAILYSILFGPVCEELVFRGVTMRLFERVCPFALANFLQALLFGIFHGNWLQGCYAFLLGLVLGAICEKGDSIWYSVLAHIFFNFLGTFGYLLLSPLYDSDFYGYFFLGALILFLGFGCRFYIKGCKQLKARRDRLDYLHKTCRHVS